MTTVKIDSSTLKTLSSIQVSGNSAKITQALDRAQYVKTNKILELLGGKWNKSKKAHVFDENCSEAIADALTTGEVFDSKKAFQFFETPELLAREIVSSLEGTNLRIGEPSAGKGRICKAAYEAGHKVDAIEIQSNFSLDLYPWCSRILVGVDFLQCSKSDFEHQWDAILMNPPFSKSQDIKHVLHAWNFLEKGGRLRAILSPGFTFRQDKIACDFRVFIESIKAEIKELPENTFKESGTNVRTVLISAEKR